MKNGGVMKRFVCFIFVLCSWVIGSAFADTMTVDWYVGDSIYDTTTCTIGGDLILPTTTPTKRGYTFTGWTQYLLLEYIQSTGTQYIDTGLAVPTSYKWELKLNTNATNTGPYWGYANNNTYSQSTSFYSLGAHGRGSSSYYISIGVFDGSIQSDARSFYDAIYIAEANYMGGNIAHTIRCNGNFEFIADGTEMTQLTIKHFSAFTPAGTAYLFARNVPTIDSSMIAKSGTKIYSYKVWDENDVLVQDFVPARRVVDNAVGMYDKVTNTFFENIGTGEFIAGPEL